MVLPGDHVGPEVIAEAVKVLDVIQASSKTSSHFSEPVEFNYQYDVFGGSSIDKHGVPITPETLQKASASDAVIFGAVGGPEWGASADSPRPEQAVLDLRKHLDCWANIRPCRFPSKRLEKRSAVKESVIAGTDFIVLRENCGGAYFGPKKEEPSFASDSWEYYDWEIERIARMAGFLAREYPGNSGGPPKRITSCDKANVLASSRLWRKVVQDIHDKEFPEIELVHQLADSAAMRMITHPTTLNGVVLCDNTFGDILSDESAVLVGSLGFLPSASLAEIPFGTKGKPKPALYEPSHGSAPDLPPNVVNPIATILSAGLMLRYTCGLGKVADLLDNVITRVLDEPEKGGLGLGTKDIEGTLGTKEMGDVICKVLKEALAQ